ncbi:AGL084Cp [Eremothecium gossypii ATCC 10895]|uniref:AGL084Cp n=1 Tax=Eremothecium gossypii (strain ATCC 10895 / CBS 109.51 / FGSC 9923 / NRRL Y-1056) TaxID=284811 RepID=Q750N4_EREGS|nr:AGL084Cp [Eremothecium gossypii ATCC 10895]AAS54406.1 AGL084Cp [Eremothecium gossypii ATCC 10895]AEY98734.1 FAGL084Cp [Eremothecium gossypii FDAG1]
MPHARHLPRAGLCRRPRVYFFLHAASRLPDWAARSNVLPAGNSERASMAWHPDPWGSRLRSDSCNQSAPCRRDRAATASCGILLIAAFAHPDTAAVAAARTVRTLCAHWAAVRVGEKRCGVHHRSAAREIPAVESARDPRTEILAAGGECPDRARHLRGRASLRKEKKSSSRQQV